MNLATESEAKKILQHLHLSKLVVILFYSAFVHSICLHLYRSHFVTVKLITKMKCIHKLCLNSTDKPVNSNAASISFFRFPTDAKLKKVWLDFCGLEPNFQVLGSTRLCSVHSGFQFFVPVIVMLKFLCV